MRFTRKKTLSLIIEGDNDYGVAVKETQGKRYRQIETLVRYRQPRQTASTPVECQHGRQEQRIARVYSAQGLDAQRWLGAKTVLCVERRRCTSEHCSIHQAYYLSSVATTARLWNDMVRGHWSIENRFIGPKTGSFMRIRPMLETRMPCSMLRCFVPLRLICSG